MQSAFQDIGFTGCFANPGDFAMVVAAVLECLTTDQPNAQCCAVAPITIAIVADHETTKM
jgi:hypothetical protein